MVQLSASGLAKRFASNYIFKAVNLEAESGQTVALLGPNGSGKSTLLQVLYGSTAPTLGVVSLLFDGKKIAEDEHFKLGSFCSPALWLPPDITAAQFLGYHFSIRQPSIVVSAMLELVQLDRHAHKLISDYSSGMRQRLKLALVLFDTCPIAYLDEPCTNLDASGIALYKALFQEHLLGKLVFIASNDPQEYTAATISLLLSKYQ